MIHIAATLETAAGAMTPLETILVVIALISFPLACFGTLAILLKASWGLRGYVEAQKAHADVQLQLVAVIREFAETQKEANQHLQNGQDLLSQRLDRFDAEREDVHLAVRAMNRKLNYLEGEDVRIEQRPA